MGIGDDSVVELTGGKIALFGCVRCEGLRILRSAQRGIDLVVKTVIQLRYSLFVIHFKNLLSRVVSEVTDHFLRSEEVLIELLTTVN